jgi:hypothetical protein
LNTVGVASVQALLSNPHWTDELKDAGNLIWTDPLGGFCLKEKLTERLLIDGELFRPWEQKGMGVDSWWDSRVILHRFECDALKKHLEQINLLPEVRAGTVADIDLLRGFVSQQIDILDHWLDHSDKFKQDFKQRLSTEDSSLPSDTRLREHVIKEFGDQVAFKN